MNSRRFRDALEQALAAVVAQSGRPVSIPKLKAGVSELLQDVERVDVNMGSPRAMFGFPPGLTRPGGPHCSRAVHTRMGSPALDLVDVERRRLVDTRRTRFF